MKLLKLYRSMGLTSTLLLLAFTSQVRAGEATVNPTGTWELRTGNATNQGPALLALKLEGGTLTGTLSRHAGSKIELLPLEDARLKGSEIAFDVHVYAMVYENNVLQPTDTNKVTHSMYRGQISGDSIKGKVEKKSWLEENSRTLDWEAKRVKK
jgi:hypothetical protein